jgi:hypothetical protein
MADIAGWLEYIDDSEVENCDEENDFIDNED